jgi:hypothetical protein
MSALCLLKRIQTGSGLLVLEFHFDAAKVSDKAGNYFPIGHDAGSFR